MTAAEPRVTMRHVREARLCASGARAFFARYDLDWATFLREGVPVSVLEATGDALAAPVCARVREEAANGR